MDRSQRLDVLSWSLIACIAGALLGSMTKSGFRLEAQSLVLPVGCSLGLLVLRFVYTRWRPDPRIAAALGSVAQIIAFTCVGAPLSYVLASLDRPFWDPAFQAWDMALGLDWRAYLTFVEARPWLWNLLGLSYASLSPQLIVAAVLLALTGRIAEARRFTFAVILSGTVAIVIAGFMPAIDVFVHLGVHPVSLPSAPFVSAVHVEALRNGTMRTLDLARLEGLITFPSYHAALAAIFAAAFWPIRWLRWPAVLLNLGVILSTPVHGGHYFVDVLAGLILAAASLGVAAALASSRALPSARSGRPLESLRPTI